MKSNILMVAGVLLFAATSIFAQTPVTQASDGSVTLSGTANNILKLTSSNTNNTGIEMNNSASGLDYILAVGGTTSGGLFPNEFAVYAPAVSDGHGNTGVTGLAVDATAGAIIPQQLYWGFSSATEFPGKATVDTAITRFAVDQIAVINPNNSGYVGTMVAAGFRMWNQAPPTCDSNARGTIVTVYGSGSADDHFEACLQKGGSLGWQTIN